MEYTVPPTADEMQHFAKGFSLEEWALLCESQEFMNTFPEDINPCRVMAEKILATHAKQTQPQTPAPQPA
jgi:hypothetical protein